MHSPDELARRAKDASSRLRTLPGERRSSAIRAMGVLIQARRADLLQANREDVAAAAKAGLGAAKLDRLKLDEKRLDEVLRGLEAVAAQTDPVGQVVDERKGPSGILCRRVRAPLGVILMIFEARPNVTAEAAALCLRSGNAVLLKGGHEAERTNRAIGACLQEALKKEGLPAEAVQMVEGGHDTVDALVKLEGLIDVVIPRGGEGLIRSVAEKSRIPVIKHYKGNCHVYVDAAADAALSRTIVTNAKAQRPGTCNAAEKLLIHEKVAPALLPSIAEQLTKAGVQLRGDEAARKLVPGMSAATAADWDEEYLDLIMAVKVVKSLEEAMAHIQAHGSAHTDAIVTADPQAAQRFLNEVDSASVMWNCSTRLADGGQYGLGAEIGISTGKLHARGPMGAEELTCLKWVVLGEGQIRT